MLHSPIKVIKLEPQTELPESPCSLSVSPTPASTNPIDKYSNVNMDTYEGENTINFLPKVCSTPSVSKALGKPTENKSFNIPNVEPRPISSQHAWSENLKRKILKPYNNQDDTQLDLKLPLEAANTETHRLSVRVKKLSELMTPGKELRNALPKSALQPATAAETLSNAPATIFSSFPITAISTSTSTTSLTIPTRLSAQDQINTIQHDDDVEVLSIEDPSNVFPADHISNKEGSTVLDLHCSPKRTHSQSATAVETQSSATKSDASVTTISSNIPTTSLTNTKTTTADAIKATSSNLLSAQNQIDTIQLDDDLDAIQIVEDPLNIVPADHISSSEDSTQVLDLHCSPKKVSQVRATQQPKTASNDPSSPVINSELFDAKLDRMSNNEIMDLRKQNSTLASNWQDRQLALEHGIQVEILRRNLSGNSEGLPDKVMSSNPLSQESDFQDPYTQYLKRSTVAQQNRKLTMRRTRLVSQELQTYLSLSESVATRLKSGASTNSKRLLYTEDYTNTEDQQFQMPKKQEVSSKNSRIQITNAIDRQIEQPLPTSTNVSQDVNSKPATSGRTLRSTANKNRNNIVTTISVPTSSESGNDSEDSNTIPIVPTPPGVISSRSATAEVKEVSSSAQVNKDADHNIPYMEGLRMLSPTPSPTPQLSPTTQDILANQPSCSRAARESVTIVPPSQTSSNGSSNSIEHNEATKSGSTTQSTNNKNVNIIDVITIPPRAVSTASTSTNRSEDSATISNHSTTAEVENSLPTADHQNNKKADQESLRMEGLRMLSETPPTTQLSPTTQEILDNQPSSSRAARAALRKSQAREQRKQKNLRPKKSENTIKENTNINTSRALERLRMGNNSLPTFNTSDYHDTGNRRRSDRGQVPLRNTWCHTQKDPFAFMRRDELKRYKPKPKSQRTSTSKSHLEATRQPLGSSTPIENSNRRDSAIKRSERDRQQRAISANEIIEEPEDQFRSTRPVTRSNKRKAQSNSIQNPQSKRARLENVDALETQQNFEQDDLSIDTNPADIDEVDLPPAEADLETDPPTEYGHNDFMDWLRGFREFPPGSLAGSSSNINRSDSVIFMPASHLQFSLLDGIEYAFCYTHTKCSLGYMRFQAMQVKDFQSCEFKYLRFIVLHGQFCVQSGRPNSKDLDKHVLNTGDLIEIKLGNRYNIKNTLNEVSVLFVNNEK